VEDPFRAGLPPLRISGYTVAVVNFLPNKRLMFKDIPNEAEAGCYQIIRIIILKRLMKQARLLLIHHKMKSIPF
jgi:hypothetical protein